MSVFAGRFRTNPLENKDFFARNGSRVGATFTVRSRSPLSAFVRIFSHKNSILHYILRSQSLAGICGYARKSCG